MVGWQLTAESAVALLPVPTDDHVDVVWLVLRSTRWSWMIMERKLSCAYTWPGVFDQEADMGISSQKAKGAAWPADESKGCWWVVIKGIVAILLLSLSALLQALSGRYQCHSQRAGPTPP